MEIVAVVMKLHPDNEKALGYLPRLSGSRGGLKIGASLKVAYGDVATKRGVSPRKKTVSM
jgi:hypothetical protein